MLLQTRHASRVCRALRTRRLTWCAAHSLVHVSPPLARRPPEHQDTLANVLAWQQSVHQRIQDIGEGFATLDGGPTADELRTEVGWVMEDVIAEVQTGPEARWEQCDWRQLQLDVQLAERRQQQPGQWRVRLRASVADLTDWWRQRLEDRVPYQYLVSTAHWRTYVFAVAPGVLIPRPETEIFPELVQAALRDSPHLASLPWVDLGTGSGAIAVGAAEVLRKRTQAPQVIAVDISPVAVAHAQYNAAASGLGPHITVLQGSWFEPVCQHLAAHDSHPASQQPASRSSDSQQPASRSSDSQQSASMSSGSQQKPPAPGQAGADEQSGEARQKGGASRVAGWSGGPRLGGVLSNPPYIPRSVMEAGLQAEVGRHEPWTALDGGPGDGMDSLEVLCRGAAASLVKDGFLALETAGKDQAALVASLLQSLCAFEDIRAVKDCYGVSRYVVARRL